MATYPEQYQVLDGIVYGPNDNDFTGNLTLPAETTVVNTIPYGGNGGTDLTGNVIVPTVAQVQAGVAFSSSGSAIGVLGLPIEDNVRDGVFYGVNNGSMEGTVVLPEQYEVADSVQYGADGIEFTGNLTLPEVYEVSNGTTFGGNGGADHTGNATFPPAADVANGTQYGGNGTEFTGTLTGLFSATDAARLEDIFNKLPSSDYLAGSDNADGSIDGGGGGGGGGGVSMSGQLLGSVRVVGPQNVSLGNVSGLSAFNGSCIVGQAENGTARFAIGATVANATYGNPIADGASAVINAGPNAGSSTSISLSVPSGCTLWLLSYKQPRIDNEY